MDEELVQGPFDVRDNRASIAALRLSKKPRAARNARRHGLNLPVLHDPTLSREVEDLARRIAKSVAGDDTDARHHELACRIAEAQLDLVRVRQARKQLLVETPDELAAVAQLAPLDRYERRAMSRRKFAIRAFDAAVVSGILAKRS